MRNSTMIVRLVIFIGVICVSQLVVAAEPYRLRVLSYNIHHGEGTDRELDLERIANAIVQSDADIVALQEVDKNVTRSASVDQAAQLAKLTKMSFVFGANIELQGGQYGNAILSRHDIVAHTNHALPNVDNGEQRGALVSTIELATGVRIHVVGTHFDHRRADEERISSAEFVNKLKLSHPAILAGDMNAVRESSPIQILLQKWKTSKKPMATVPVDQPRRQIDFVFHQPAHRWELIETKVLKESVASDHRAILAVLQLLP